MRQMFTSATLKLTGWYLLILVAISLLFSFIIYELSTSEISSRLERLQVRLEGESQTITLPGPLTLTDLRMNQTKEAKTSIFIGLVYMNIAVISIGGVGSYLLARRTIRPIEEAHEAQSRFTSDASHELRTPLAVMKSEIQVLLRDNASSKQDYRDVLESNLEEVDKLAQLSQALLQLSRLDYDNAIQTDRIDIDTAISSAIKSLNIPSTRIRRTINNKPIYVDGNESMIHDLCKILLENAVQYSPDNSPIQIETISNGRTCKVQISNEGEGIAKDSLDKIFDRFYRGESSRTTQHNSGYGLGLSLARKITTIHDGTISASSTPGKLTTFTVTLPQIRKNR